MLTLCSTALVSALGQCVKPGFVDQKRTLGPAGSPLPSSVADVNGDGKQDLASFQAPDKLLIAMGIGGGNFGPSTTYVIGSNRSKPFWGDLNGDGKPEMLLTNFAQLDVWMNDGQGVFSLVNSFIQAGTITGFADFNGDGKGDLLLNVLGGPNPSQFAIRFGTGTGGFGNAMTYFGFGPNNGDLVSLVGDFNGDGKPDVAASLNRENTAIRIYLNDGSGSLLLPPSNGITATQLLAVVDLDGDGKSEVIGSLYQANRVLVAKNTGVNTYASQLYTTVGYPGDAQVIDFDGDGKRDLILNYYLLGFSDQQYPGQGVMLGDGLGGFTGFEISKPRFDLAADLNNDGKTDFISFGTVDLTYEVAVITRQSTCSGPGDPWKIDFTGDGRSEFAVFHPSTGFWSGFDSPAYGSFSGQLGAIGDVPAPGDFDGDGKTDIGIFRPSNGVWNVLRSSDHTIYSVAFGQTGDKPVPGDFDGDGRTDIAVYRPSNGGWYMIRSGTNTFLGVAFGLSADVPVPADLDGDRKVDITVFRPADGVWYSLYSATNSFVAQPWGSNGDRAVAADYDGDGKADIAVFRPSNGVWYILRSYNSSMLAVQWGAAGDVPVPGFTGGAFTPRIGAVPMVWRPSNNRFYWPPTAFESVIFAAGDVPVSSPYVVE
ncbi:MAG: VCBS repeat-containing protein [Pyrinomonadaceae bacterium]